MTNDPSLSQVWQTFCTALGAKVSHSSGYHPQSNGQTERAKIKSLRPPSTACPLRTPLPGVDIYPGSNMLTILSHPLPQVYHHLKHHSDTNHHCSLRRKGIWRSPPFSIIYSVFSAYGPRLGRLCYVLRKKIAVWWAVIVFLLLNTPTAKRSGWLQGTYPWNPPTRNWYPNTLAPFKLTPSLTLLLFTSSSLHPCASIPRSMFHWSNPYLPVHCGFSPTITEEHSNPLPPPSESLSCLDPTSTIHHNFSNKSFYLFLIQSAVESVYFDGLCSSRDSFLSC